MPAAPLPLLCHPATPCPCLTGIEVAVERLPTGGLRLAYRLRGDLQRLRLPAPQPAGPADHLWQHTCCEAFVASGDSAYREFNFSPSGQWALYDFAAYRERVPGAPPPAAPAIALQAGPGELRLEATLAAALLPPGGQRQLGLSVVVETTDGDKSYWALAHPAIQPDFHRREAFLLALPATAT